MEQMEISRLTLAADDVLVVHIKRHLSRPGVTAIKEQFESYFPMHRVLVIGDPDLSLMVVSKPYLSAEADQ